MADLVMGAIRTIIPKLYQLLEKEYNLQANVKERISSLTQELELAQAALGKVAEVPWDQLDKQVQIWARKVREASYDMEDVLDTFLVRVEGPESTEEKKNLLKHTKISGDVENIMTHLQEVTDQCRRYKVGDIGTRTATTSSVDPRLHAMYTQVNKLVGVDKSSGDLMSKLQLHDTMMKKVSIVGVGGLGKTTLAKVVYDKIKGDFSCTAFVAIGRDPDFKKIFKDILIDLDRQKYLYISTAELDEKQFIDELRNFLGNQKRFLIVIDDIWEIETWEQIKLAFGDDKNCGDRIIITTRKSEVATNVDDVYKLQPLPVESSRELLYARINGHKGGEVDSELDKISDKFIRKCGGIPLAIITMSSLLAGKPRDKWSELYSTIDFGSKDNKEAGNTMKILSFSYYDMPSHLRTCLLYLSASMEDTDIDKGSLVWRWVAEGFVHEKKGVSLFEIGERYFNDLMNRSMIQAVHSYKQKYSAMDNLFMKERSDCFDIATAEEKAPLQDSLQSRPLLQRLKSDSARSNDMPLVILDNQAQVNCTGVFNVLSNLRIGTENVVLAANGAGMETFMSGSVNVRNFELPEVHYCPDLGDTLIVSGSMLDNDDYGYEFRQGKFTVKDLKISNFGISRFLYGRRNTAAPKVRATGKHNSPGYVEFAVAASAKGGAEIKIGSHVIRVPKYLSVHHPLAQMLLFARNKFADTFACCKSMTPKSIFDIAKRLRASDLSNWGKTIWNSAKPKSESPKVGTFSDFSTSQSIVWRNEHTENESHPRYASGAAWVAAAGAPHHATGKYELLSGFVIEYDGRFVHAVDGIPRKVLARGAVITDSVVLPDVWFVPGLTENLVSVSQLVELDHSVGFSWGECCVRTSEGKVVGKGHLQEGGLYVLDFLKVPLAI